MLSYELDTALNTALDASVAKGQVFNMSNLTLAVIQTPSIQVALRAMQIDIDGVVHHLTNAIALDMKEAKGDDAETTLMYKRTLQRAYFYSAKDSKREVTSLYMLMAIFGENKSTAVRILYEYDITYSSISDLLRNDNASTAPASGKQVNPWTNATEAKDKKMNSDGNSIWTNAPARSRKENQKPQPDKKKSPLELYTVNLNEMVTKGKIDPLIGRDLELQRAIQILSRRKKNNPIFVGDAGVGKTAIAEGLAYRIVHNEVPKAMKDIVIYSMNVGVMLAGTRFRGDFEDRLTGVLNAVKDDPNKMLFIDEIHMMIGAGAGSANDVDAANIMKPLLSDGSLQCIGATTYDEYRKIFEKDQALSRRFQMINVSPTTVEDTIAILHGIKDKYELHHCVEYTDEAIRAIVELSDRYISERHLPDKALDVMDEAGAFRKLEGDDNDIVDLAVVEATVSRIAQIPASTVSSTDIEQLGTLDDDLNSVVFGQETAVANLTSAIKMSRSGLGRDNKPIGSFLFLGPTGVGKTEVTQQMAKHMGVEMIRFDMSEYQERHSVSQLVGAPPGYVGYEERGQLTDAVLKHPHAILLLDEIEKAHPNVYNLFLQVMDNGSLTDSNGREVDFRNVILVMTSNAGAKMAQRRTMGFAKQDHSSDVIEVVNDTFSPEFRNRLDAVVRFNTLEEDVIYHIVDKFLSEFTAQLQARDVTAEITNRVREWVASDGYDVQMGARPMERFIQDNIKKPMAEALLFGELVNGGTVVIDHNEDGILFEYNVLETNDA